MHRFLKLTLISRTRSRRLHADEKGLVLVFVLILMTVMLGMLALVVDLGNGRQQRRQAQTSADASALAAAEVLETRSYDFVFDLPTTWAQVVTQVKGYAKQNWGVKASDWNGCHDAGALAYRPDGNGNTCISADFSLWSPPLPGDPINTVDRVRVHIPDRSIRTVFGSVLGANSLSTGATATAAVTRTTHSITTTLDTTTPGGPCALCILSPTGLTLDGQNGDVTITGGGVTVNSTSSTAASLAPNGHVKITLPCDNTTTPPTCQTIGGPNAPANFSGAGFSPAPVAKSPVDDPLAAVPQCGNGSPGTVSPIECPTTFINTAAKSLPTNLTPGIYRNGFENSHTLAPGVYVLMGDIVLNGNDQITGDGVTLFFGCDHYPSYNCNPGETGAGIKTTGNGAKKDIDNGSMRLTAPTSGTYKGLTIFSDRNNASALTFRGNGSNESGPQSGSSGTIYAKAGTLDLRGNGYTLASMVVVNNFTMKGNPSAVTLAYDLSKNYYVATHHTSTTTNTSFSYDDTGLVG